MSRIAIMRSRAAQICGFSYVEVLVATLIMAVCVPAALDALSGGVSVARAGTSHTVNQQRIKSRLEEVLANRFTTLDAAAMAAGNSPGAVVPGYSDASGTPDRLIVNLYRYDGTVPTATDSGLLWVKVSIEGSVLALNTLAAR